jgi:hypothetical protein
MARDSPSFVIRVLHLHPTEAPAGLIAAVGALRDNPLESHGAGMAEHCLAVLRVEVLAVDQRRRRLPELRPE